MRRAGGRLALSGAHTVVALAGTTGSGKSSLFNALAGAPLSPAGLRRPTTGTAHAVVFAQPGTEAAAGSLLDWLGVGVRFTVADEPASGPMQNAQTKCSACHFCSRPAAQRLPTRARTHARAHTYASTCTFNAYTHTTHTHTLRHIRIRRKTER